MASTDNENLINQTTSRNTNIPIYNASSSHQHSYACNDPSHHHDYPSVFDHNDEHLSSINRKNEMFIKRKEKKNFKQNVTRAELIPGHQGDKNIDDLVNFINGPSKSNNTTNKKSKK